MRSSFPGYCDPDQAYFDRLWAEALFVVDTNTLLNLYRFPPSASSEILTIFARLSDRIWIPHQVALEFYKNYPNVLKEQQEAYALLSADILKKKSELLNLLKTGSENRHPFLDVEEIRKSFEPAFDEAESMLKRQREQSDILTQQKAITDQIEDLFKDSVGSPYTTAQLLDIYRIGQQRYELQIPPGYADAKNKDHVGKFGDLIIWFQMMDMAKASQRPLIFICDDKKEDWIAGKRGARTGPRPELIQEMYVEAGVQFYVYSASNFAQRAAEYLSIKLEPSVVKDIQEVEKFNRRYLELLSSDESKLRDVINASINMSELPQTAELVLEHMIQEATLDYQIRSITQKWAQKITTDHAQQEFLLNAVDLTRLGSSIRELLFDDLPPRVLPLFASISSESIINIPFLQSALRQLLQDDNAAKLANDDMTQLLAWMINGSILNSQLAAAIRTAVGEALDSGVVSEVALPVLADAIIATGMQFPEFNPSIQ